MVKYNIERISKIIMLFSIFIVSVNTACAASSVEIDIEVEAAIKKFKIEVGMDEVWELRLLQAWDNLANR